MSDTIEKVSIIISKGSLEGIYPGMIMANGVRTEGNDANLFFTFFTFFGLDAIHEARIEHIKLATVGNPGLHFATMAGGLPGVSTVMAHYMNHKMEQLDTPSIPEFIEQVRDIITVGEFYEVVGESREPAPSLSVAIPEPWAGSAHLR